MAYGEFKDLPRRTASNKVLLDQVFNTSKNLKYDGYQRGLASMVYKFFNKETASGGIKNEVVSNQEIAEEIHKPIIRKLDKKYNHLL